MAEETIEGKIVRVVWQNDEDRFFIFRLSTSQGQVTAKGTVLAGDLIDGLGVQLKGEWKSHPKYGRSFAFNRFKIGKAKTPEGMVRVLQAGIKGIGPVTARNMVEHFGQDLVKVLSKTPERLLEMKAFQTPAGNRKYERIVNKWKGFRGELAVASFLMGHGLGPATTKKVYAHFGEDTIHLIKENPYYLLDVSGVGFNLADKIAFALDCPPDAPWRIQAAIYHVINRWGGQNGHLFLTRDELYDRILQITKLGVRNFGRQLLDSEVFDMCKLMGQDDFRPVFCQLVLESPDRVYMWSRFKFEQESAELLSRLMWTDVPRQVSPKMMEEFTNDYEADEQIELSAKQREGLLRAVTEKVMLLTGLPGTGKTTLLKGVMRLFEAAKVNVALLAPTGIAAKRMSQVTGRPASTIHRALQFKGAAGWGRNQSNMLPVDAVIVDESSMVDQEVFYRLLSALPVSCRLLIVGDPAQLPSVGPGNVLHQLITSGTVPHVHLTDIFRQSEASDIVTNAHRITNGEVPIFDSGRGRDFHFFQMEDDDRTISRILRAAVAFQEKGRNFHVISPMHNGEIGVTNLNEVLKEELNPPSDFGTTEAQVGKFKWFREGDRIMVTVNNYDLGVFNGDMSVVHNIDVKGKKLSFYIDGEIGQELKTISFTEANEMLKLAFCTTVHKMQGLEADIIMMPFTMAFGIMLQRNLLYTAVTRAKKKVFIFGEWKAVRKAVRTLRVQLRNTRFADRLNVEFAAYQALVDEDGPAVIDPRLRKTETIEDRALAD